MKKVKVTFKRLLEFNIYAVSYLQGTKEKTKLKHAIERVAPFVDDAKKIKGSKIEDIRIDCASIDEKGNLIINEGKNGDDRYSFTPAKLKEFKKLVAELENEEVEIKQYIAKIIPTDLSYSEVEAYRGIIIPEDYEFIEEDEKVEEIKNSEETLA